MGGEGDDRGEVVGWHHLLDGHGFEQALGDGEGQGGLACCSPWGCEELDTTEHLDNRNSDDARSYKHTAPSLSLPLLMGAWVASTSRLS